MTVQTQFWNWQDAPMSPDPKRCAPIGGSWFNYLLATWGGQNIGCYNPRPVRGGGSPSTHWSGAAIDWRYQNPGIGRTRMLNEVMPWLLNNSLELGLQAVHDYAGMRIWRPPGTSGRPTSPSPDCGWRPNSGSNMNPSSTWLHLECLNTRWSDARSVQEMMSTVPTIPIGDDDDMKHVVADGRGQQLLGPGWRYWAKNINEAGIMNQLYGPPQAMTTAEYDLATQMLGGPGDTV